METKKILKIIFVAIAIDLIFSVIVYINKGYSKNIIDFYFETISQWVSSVGCYSSLNSLPGSCSDLFTIVSKISFYLFCVFNAITILFFIAGLFRKFFRNNDENADTKANHIMINASLIFFGSVIIYFFIFLWIVFNWYHRVTYF